MFSVISKGGDCFQLGIPDGLRDQELVACYSCYWDLPMSVTRFIVLHVSEIKCYYAECVCLSLRYCLSGLINISLWLP